MSGPKIYTIAASAPFAAVFAKGLIARTGDGPAALADALVYLPTRRAARSFADVFARAAGGAALLPQFQPLGDVDEDDLLFDPAADALDLAPAIAPLRRQMLLANLIRQWDRRRGGAPMSFAQAAALAESLGAVMDEIETQGADPAQLDTLAPAALAQHWQDVARLLALMQKAWPSLLAAEGRMSAAARRNAALAALSRRLEEQPPQTPVIAAGSTGSIPATAHLLGVIARLPQGAVILPGLDRELDAESWDALDPGHPQFGLKQLLTRLGVAREAVADWAPAEHFAAREALLREALRPAPTTDAWRALAESETARDHLARGLDGLQVIEAENSAEEALIVALALREALEKPGQSAALVTPDRELARRVAGELRRWKIAIDDSGGQPLAHRPAGSFLCLLAEAAGSDFAPVPLLALLKHPFTTLGQPPALFRARARLLDRTLRGPRPDPGLAGIARRIETTRADPRRAAMADDLLMLSAWWDGVAGILRPLEALFAAGDILLSDMLAAHGAAAEHLAAAADGETMLWRGSDGARAAAFIGGLSEAAEDLPAIEAHSYPALFRTLARKPVVRAPYGHARLAILGPLEARLQTFDLTILGGLNEGSWPSAMPADPWFSRPMRAALGLEQPERGIELAAHDFAMLAAGPRVLLTHARKARGAPAIRSRWLQRLAQLTQGLGIEAARAPMTDYRTLAARLADITPKPRLARPHPTPPVAARPRRLSVTEIETWLRDPYAIYARHVLDLRPWRELDEEIGPLERGNAVHQALELFLRRYPDALPPDAGLALAAIADEVFAEAGVPKAALALWRPRFLGAAQWFAGVEQARRTRVLKSHLEIRGERVFTGPQGDFLLHGRADRIDELQGGGAAILDYKTGALPTIKQVRELLSPQLPLEGAILAAGGFAEIGAAIPAELVYLRVSGGAKPGEERPFPDAAALSEEAAELLSQRIAFFDMPATPYWPRVKPYRADLAGDYDHLARVREWSLAGWIEAEE